MCVKIILIQISQLLIISTVLICIPIVYTHTPEAAQKLLWCRWVMSDKV